MKNILANVLTAKKSLVILIMLPLILIPIIILSFYQHHAVLSAHTVSPIAKIKPTVKPTATPIPTATPSATPAPVQRTIYYAPSPTPVSYSNYQQPSYQQTNTNNQNNSYPTIENSNSTSIACQVSYGTVYTDSQAQCDSIKANDQKQQQQNQQMQQQQQQQQAQQQQQVDQQNQTGYDNCMNQAQQDYQSCMATSASCGDSCTRICSSNLSSTQFSCGQTYHH